MHTRHGAGMQISEVALQLSVETRGPVHREEVVAVLRRAGYEPEIIAE
jgi:threonine dehydratase